MQMHQNIQWVRITSLLAKQIARTSAALVPQSVGFSDLHFGFLALGQIDPFGSPNAQIIRIKQFKPTSIFNTFMVKRRPSFMDGSSARRGD